MSKEKAEKKGLLGVLESFGNALPHPIYLFVILALVVVVISVFTAGITIVHPGTGEEAVIKSLASRDGIIWMFANVVNNFTRFPPLGMVLVMMIGLGLAEETGLLRTVLRKAIVGAPKTLVSFIVVFAGVMGNIAGSATFVVIPPLGGLLFKALKRNPIAGIAAGFSGVAAGLSANLLITPTDVLLSGITEKAAQIIDPNMVVHPAVNWFFMIASTILLSAVGVFVTEKIVEPRLGALDPKYASEEEDPNEDVLMVITENEKKGLKYAGITSILYFVLIALTIIPKNGVLRDPVNGTIVPSPFLSSTVTILLLWFMFAALAYGIGSKTIKNSNDVIKYMTDSMKSFAGFIVLCFFAAQFVEFFAYTNLGLLLSVKGGEFLQASNFVGIPLVVAFVLFTGFCNFFIGSASAKWALLAPIFVPMFMQVGISPAFTMAAYRISDSVINCISPLEPFIPFIIVCAQRYDKRAGLGTIISTMVPYALVYLVAWTALLVLFAVFNLPIGPGAYMGF